MRRLASDYAYDYPRVSPFFSGDPRDPAAWRDAIHRTQQHPRARHAVADLLLAQQRRRGAPAEAVAAAERLRDERTVAVVTGQQAGLFGGPLFTLLKAITAVRLAEQAAAEHNVPTVAVFWIDAEDHDWDEVRACGVFDPDLEARSVALGARPGAGQSPVAAVRLDESISGVLEQLRVLLPPTEFTSELLGSLARAYRAGQGMADAFGQWLESVLGHRGLVVFDASDPAAKPLAAGIFAREIEHPGEASRLADEAGAALRALDYHAQVTPHEGSVALFSLGAGREPIRRQGDSFVSGSTVESKAELLARVARAPETFSPNVLLRPLVQDTLFPTVCYVSGPSELAYLGQLGGIYRAFGLPMPLIQPRATATILDANALRFLTRYGLPLEALRAGDEAALNELLQSQLPPSVEASMHDAARAVDDRLTSLAAEVRQIDPTLEGATSSTLGRMQDDLKKLHNKIIQAAKRKDDTLRRQFHHAQAQAFPAGHPQEREIGFVSFLNAYGPVLVERLLDDLPLDLGVHWVIAI
jgi:bacillithiol biosynthesis cysteine-adding enzyme BshC